MIARVSIKEAIRIAQYKERINPIPACPRIPAHHLNRGDYKLIKKLAFGSKVMRAPAIKKKLLEERGRSFSVVTIYRAIRKIEAQELRARKGSQ